jgi:mono/diheme cytochrome c family protein
MIKLGHVLTLIAFAGALQVTTLAAAMPIFGKANVAAERGYKVAARECAGCHAIDKTGESPRPGAPPFRDVRRHYNEISLEREFQAIREVGHYAMPPKPISQADGRDLIAYIESLGHGD